MPILGHQKETPGLMLPHAGDTELSVGQIPAATRGLGSQALSCWQLQETG